MTEPTDREWQVKIAFDLGGVERQWEFKDGARFERWFMGDEDVTPIVVHLIQIANTKAQIELVNQTIRNLDRAYVACKVVPIDPPPTWWERLKDWIRRKL